MDVIQRWRIWNRKKIPAQAIVLNWETPYDLLIAILLCVGHFWRIDEAAWWLHTLHDVTVNSSTSICGISTPNYSTLELFSLFDKPQHDSISNCLSSRKTLFRRIQTTIHHPTPQFRRRAPARQHPIMEGDPAVKSHRAPPDQYQFHHCKRNAQRGRRQSTAWAAHLRRPGLCAQRLGAREHRAYDWWFAKERTWRGPQLWARRWRNWRCKIQGGAIEANRRGRQHHAS